MTFSEILLYVAHEARKLPNEAIAKELVQKFEPFAEYCRSDGRVETLLLVVELQRLLVNSSVDEVMAYLAVFRQHTIAAGIEHLEPTFMDREIWRYVRRGQTRKIGLLFSNCDHVIRLALEAVLKNQLGFSRPARQFFIKNLNCDVTVICSHKDWACLKASGIPFNTCIVLDTDVPSDSMPDTFISLPMCRDGYVKLCRSLIA